MSATPTTTGRIRLKDCCSDIPLGLQTIYNRRSLGQIDWLSRVSPRGKKTRDLWVDVQRCKEWARWEGVSLGRSFNEGAAG